MFAICACLSLIAAVPNNSVHVVLEARYRTQISSDITSKVEEIDKHMGESFEKGDVLMQLDNKVFAANLSKAQSKVEETEVKYQAAKRLHTDRVVSEAEVVSVKAANSEALANLAIAEKEYDACTLVAPYDGKVQQVFVQQFERVEPGQKLMELVDDSVLLARFYAPSTLLPQQLQGGPLTFNIEELGETIAV